MDQKLNNSAVSSNYDSCLQRAPTSTTTHGGMPSTTATTTFADMKSKLEQSTTTSCLIPTDTKKTKSTAGESGGSPAIKQKNSMIGHAPSRTVDNKNHQKQRPKRNSQLSLEVKAKTPFSRAVRIASDTVSMDPELQLKKLIKNKMEHLDFNPSYCNFEWRQHYQELFDNSQYDVNINEQFVEKLQGLKVKDTDSVKQNMVPTCSKIQHPTEIQTVGDAIAYGRVIRPRKVFWQFHTKVQSQEGTDNVGMRSPEMIREGKEYILSHYHRTFGDKLESQGAKEPDYVSNFKYIEAVDVKAKLRALKKYGYDKEWEDQQLKKIQRDIAISGDKVAKRLKGFGIINLEDVPTFDGVEEVSEEETFRSGCSAEVRGDDLNDGFVPPNKSPKSVILKEKLQVMKNEYKAERAAAKAAKEDGMDICVFRRPANHRQVKGGGRARGAKNSMLSQTVDPNKKLNNRVTFKPHAAADTAPKTAKSNSPKGKDYTSGKNAISVSQGIERKLDEEIDPKWRQKSAPRGQNPPRPTPESPGTGSQSEEQTPTNIQLKDYPFGEKQQISRSKERTKQELEKERMKLRSSEIKTRIKDFYKGHPELVLVSRHDDDEDEEPRARTSYQTKRGRAKININSVKNQNDYSSAQSQTRNNFMTISTHDQTASMSNTIQDPRGTQSGCGIRSQIQSPGGRDLISNKGINMQKRRTRHKAQFQVNESLKLKYGRHLAANREQFRQKQLQIQPNNQYPKYPNAISFRSNSRSGTGQTLTAASSSIEKKLGKIRGNNNYSQDIRGQKSQGATILGKSRQLTSKNGLQYQPSTTDGSAHQQWKDSSIQMQDCPSDANNLNEPSASQQQLSQQDFSLNPKCQNLMAQDDGNNDQPNELNEPTKSIASQDSGEDEIDGGLNMAVEKAADESAQQFVNTSLSKEDPMDNRSQRHRNCKRTKKYIKAMREKAIQAQKAANEKEQLPLAPFFPPPPKDYATLSRISKEMDQIERKKLPVYKQQGPKGPLGTKKQAQIETIEERTDPMGDVEGIIERIGAATGIGKDADTIDKMQELGVKLGAINKKQEQSIERLDFIRGIRAEQQAEKEMMMELMAEGRGEKVRDRDLLRAELNEQDNKQDTYFTQKMKEFKHYQKFQMAQDYNNLLRKDVIAKMAHERQENSLKLAMMRGKQHIWRPDKFTLTKYGPKIKFN